MSDSPGQPPTPPPPPGAAGSPISDREFIERALRWGIIGASALGVLLLLLWLLKSALTPLMFALLIAYLCDPLIDRFEAVGVGRRLAIFLLLALFALLGFALAFAVIPRIQREVAALAETLPGYIDGALARLSPLLDEHLGLHVPESLRQALDEARAQGLTPPMQTLRQLLGEGVRTLTGTAGALVGLLVVPVIAYYLLADFDGFKARIAALVPAPQREAVVRKAATIDELLSAFIRGQLIVCVALGTLYAVGFAAIGIQSALLIGSVAAVVAFIPYVGSALALGAASTMSLLQFGLDHHLALVVGWYVLVQSLEGYVLTPRIVGGQVGLHPVTVIVALLIGGDLLGFLGLLVAVPLAAVAQVFARDVLDAYRRSQLYTGGPSPEGG